MNLPVGTRPYGLLFDRCLGDKLYCTCTGYSMQDSLVVIDGAGDMVRTRLYAGRDPRVLVLDTQDRKLYVAARVSDSVKVYDAVADTFHLQHRGW